MIKLFEDFNQYYTKIDFSQLIDFMYYDPDTNNFNKKILSFTQDELNKLQSMLPNITFKLFKRTPSVDPYIHFTYDGRDQYVYKYTDEWYVIKKDRQIYKCDQIDGLVKCIQDIYTPL